MTERDVLDLRKIGQFAVQACQCFLTAIQDYNSVISSNHQLVVGFGEYFKAMANGIVPCTEVTN